MFGPELSQAFRDFKTIWDPQWRMNPRKVIDAQPLDADAEQLATLAKTPCELLVETRDRHPPKLQHKAILQLHWHSKSMLGADAERKILSEMGLELEQPPVGCCGHAGSFGYEVEHYPVSMQIAEQVLPPAHARTIRTPSSFPTGSVVATRSATGRGDGRSTLPKSSPRPCNGNVTAVSKNFRRPTRTCKHRCACSHLDHRRDACAAAPVSLLLHRARL